MWSPVPVRISNSRMRTSREVVAHVSVRQLLLAPLNLSPIYDGHDVGPLIAVTDNARGLILTTGCVDGPVSVVVEGHATAAPLPAPTWEVCEEVDLHIDSAVYLSSPTWAELYDPVFHPNAAGWFRVRVSAHGRAISAGLSTISLTERYVIQAWRVASPLGRQLLRDDGVTL